MKIRYISLFVTLCFVLSCKTVSDTNYMQDIEKMAEEMALRMDEATLQSGDELVINVMAKDMDVAAPFNQNYSSGKVLQTGHITGNVANTRQTNSGATYIVDSNGMIDFPVLGRISTEGKTAENLKEELYDKISRYIKQPTISVQLNNFKVSVLGEVARSGQFIIPEGKGNILQALSMAGDLTMYGVRENVLIIRSVDGKIERNRIDLTQSDFINSPYYNLKQGDIVYVPANSTKQKTARLEPNAGIYISVASIVVTILALVFRR